MQPGGMNEYNIFIKKRPTSLCKIESLTQRHSSTVDDGKEREERDFVLHSSREVICLVNPENSQYSQIVCNGGCARVNGWSMG